MSIAKIVAHTLSLGSQRVVAMAEWVHKARPTRVVNRTMVRANDKSSSCLEGKVREKIDNSSKMASMG